MMNTNYTPEIASANQFIIENENDIDLKRFLKTIMNKDYSHSEKWSLTYEWMKVHYPDRMDLVTGLTYWMEK